MIIPVICVVVAYRRRRPRRIHDHRRRHAVRGLRRPGARRHALRPDQPGRRRPGRDHRRGVGWEILHVAIDDATRLVYAELLPDEKGRTTARFLVRAVRWFRSQGIRVRRLLSDNGSPYVSRPLRRASRLLGLKHSRTRPYRPQTNGKVERWIRTVLA